MLTWVPIDTTALVDLRRRLCHCCNSSFAPYETSLDVYNRDARIALARIRIRLYQAIDAGLADHGYYGDLSRELSLWSRRHCKKAEHLVFDSFMSPWQMQTMAEAKQKLTGSNRLSYLLKRYCWVLTVRDYSVADTSKLVYVN